MYKQIIIMRRDLPMSVGKQCAQASHAAMAFLTNPIKYVGYRARKWDSATGQTVPGDTYHAELNFDKDLFEEWICGSFTKIVLGARNKNHLLKAVRMAEDLGLAEGEDFFLIKDNCYTELEPEEFDEDGVGRTLTCIGFRPMDSEVIDKIGKKYQLLK